MKKTVRILSSLVVMAGFVFLYHGCYDDTYIRYRLHDHELRIQALERLCAEMNTNIGSLQTIVTALQNNDFVTAVSPVVENGKEIGYTISFSKSGHVTIYHGKDGADGKNGKDGTNGTNGTNGKDGVSPVIGVKQDADGIWYWTLNGEWLLDAQGNKIKASATDGKDGKDGKDGENGKDGQDGSDGQDGKDGQDGQDGTDGITPLLKIEADYWYISYDDGETWTVLGKATGEDGTNGTDGKDGTNGVDGQDGTSFFKSVEDTDTAVVLTLADNTVITIPKAQPLSVEFYIMKGEDKVPVKDGDQIMVASQMIEKVYYKVTSAIKDIRIDAISTEDVVVLVSKNEDPRAGILLLQVGDNVDAWSRITVFVSDGTTLLVNSIGFKMKKND